MEVRSMVALLSFLLVATTAFVAQANIGDLDESWQKRAEAARAAALEAYESDPDEVAEHINRRANLALEGNSTRRGLRGRRNVGGCKATNPIDRCWRCDPNWARHRKRLASCVLGFGRKTIGGKRGRYYVVTDASDNDLVNPKPGTLRHAVTRGEPLWIIFARSMIIVLKEELMVSSYKTIDARGANVHIAYGAQITIQYVKHVIIHGLHVHHTKPGMGGMIRDSHDHFGFRTVSDGDAISIFGSSHIWIDHVSLYSCTDGLVDIIQGSTAITLSNLHLTRHDHVMLFGASDTYSEDKIMQVTVAFNHFGKGLIQRLPRCRMGYFHVLNNDYTHWIMYAIGGSTNSTIVSQGNRYIAPDSPFHKEVTHRAIPNEPWHRWRWSTENDIFENGAFFVPSGTKAQDRHYPSQDVITAKPGSWVTRLTRYAGALTCKVNRPC